MIIVKVDCPGSDCRGREASLRRLDVDVEDHLHLAGAVRSQTLELAAGRIRDERNAQSAHSLAMT